MDVGKLIVAAMAGGLVAAVGALFGLHWARRAPDPKTAERRRKLALGISAGLCGGASQLGGAWGLADQINLALGLTSRLEVLAAEGTRAVWAHPAFTVLIEGKSQAEANAIAADLGAKGLQHLDLPDLQTMTKIRLNLAESDPVLCARMARGTADSALTTQALGRLPEEEIRSWLRITTTAMLRVLDEGPRNPPGPEVMRDGLTRIMGVLSPGDRQLLAHDDEMSDEQACMMLRVILKNSVVLPPQLQTDFLRAMSLS